MLLVLISRWKALAEAFERNMYNICVTINSMSTTSMFVRPVSSRLQNHEECLRNVQLLHAHGLV